jgi:hypothetical protein
MWLSEWSASGPFPGTDGPGGSATGTPWLESDRWTRARRLSNSTLVALSLRLKSYESSARRRSYSDVVAARVSLSADTSYRSVSISSLDCWSVLVARFICCRSSGLSRWNFSWKKRTCPAVLGSTSDVRIGSLLIFRKP